MYKNYVGTSMLMVRCLVIYFKFLQELEIKHYFTELDILFLMFFIHKSVLGNWLPAMAGICLSDCLPNAETVGAP